jgi:hypothetical protein
MSTGGGDGPLRRRPAAADPARCVPDLVPARTRSTREVWRVISSGGGGTDGVSVGGGDALAEAHVGLLSAHPGATHYSSATAIPTPALPLDSAPDSRAAAWIRVIYTECL